MSESRKRILLAFHWYSEALHAGALRYCLERGWDGVVLNADTVAVYEHTPYDGVLSMLPPAGHPVHTLVARGGVPVVELSYAHPENREWCRCPSDGDAVGRMAADHLRRRPVASFVFVAFCAWPTHDARWAGFLSGLESDVRPCLRFDTGGGADDELSTRLDTGAPDEASTERLAAFLRTRPKPVGIFGSVDQSARQALDAALLAGLRVPGDAYILGFGNRELVSRLAPVPISSIAIDYEAWAYSAMGMLDAMMAGELEPGSLRPFPPGGVVERVSCGGESTGDPLCDRAVTLMRRHVSRPLNVCTLAARLGVSKSTLTRAFTEACGTGVAARYLQLRLEVARGLLASGEKVEAVARFVGFASPRAFRSAFLRSEGCTPGEFPARRR